ncbi:hypothetical protein P691DRAFT_807235 [Macrolepiota fuliginosa MF-IS2]|uniref:Uncharacterized protein n=1 Tax=Macrolepiota fuliginosa MF-IS2 TaxID=1400762 RepID=A0A9P5XM26_9AGAR|nr:hypothetical protein P691DRAFT_807235 [Macrolepiota fuliginosa MF-IS2]
MYATPTPSPSIQASPPNNSSGFLQNKALSGIVFTIAGVVGLVLLITVATIATRRSRNKRLHNEAVSFDPTPLDRGSTEKRRWSLLSSDTGHGGMGGNLGYPGTAAPIPPAYSRQGGFPAAESQRSLIGHSQQPRYGGAPAPHFSQTDLRPAWMSGNNESDPVQPPKTPSPEDRAKSPESVVYPEVGNLKVCDKAI